MSGGLYSTEGRDFDQTLDLKKIKPYGDTMNDGKTQLSFTLPVPAGDEAIEAAKQLMKKMGFENPQVVFHRELTAGYTFFNCYGSCTHTVDYSNIHVPKVESTKWDMAETDSFIREQIGAIFFMRTLQNRKLIGKARETDHRSSSGQTLLYPPRTVCQAGKVTESQFFYHLQKIV